MGISWIRAAFCLQLCVFALWNFRLSARAQQDGPLHYYDDENVIDLLEALNITRSIKGVTKAKGLEPGVPAWKFRQRVPHLTLPRDFSIYFLSTMQGSIGFHFVAQQAKSSDGTLISFISPAALKKDGRPLLQLVSSTRSNQLRLDYRAVHSMEPASILFPGGTPFSSGRWARVALNLEAHKISLFIDCEEAIVFEKSGGEDVLSLILPIDLEITFASVPGDKASKFLGYWQTAEVSTSGYIRRPWHCENLSDSVPYSFPSADMEEAYREDPSVHLQPQSDSALEQPLRSQLGPPGLQREVKPLPSSQEERIQRLEELVEGLSTMLDMVKAQNADLQLRVRYLESCECRRLTCTWEGREVEEGSRWETEQGSACQCVSGKVQCAVTDDPCLSSPCLNGGVCQVLTSDLGQQPSGFRCSCPPSAIGLFCERPVTQACSLPKMEGHCRRKADPQQRWFYNSAVVKCEEFLYNGCGGNANNFETLDTCEQQCMLGACCYRQPKLPGLLVGYDQDGYDRHGFNVSDLDRQGRRRKAETLERAGPAPFSGGGGGVFSRLGDGRTFDRYGGDRHGYDRAGFHRDTGFNLMGYNRKGEYDGRSKFGRDGYDQDGFNRAGFDCSGLDARGFNYLGLNAGFTYTCEQLSLEQCQQRSWGGPGRDVVSFSPGRTCADVACGERCGCVFMGRSYRFGESFQHGCETCACTYAGAVECTCQNPSQRKEVRDMTQEEREAYQQAVAKLYAKPGIWQDFARIRADFAPQANGRFFLPWHRYFLRLVEQELQKVSSCGVSIPYLEWTVDAGSLETSAVWQANFFGGDGDPATGCVSYHPFQGKTRWSPCLRRRFNSSVSLPDAVNLQLVLAEEDFGQFSIQMRAVSALFHLWVGGHMASELSPYDPVFLSHYAFVDRLWALWQERGGDVLLRFPAELRYVRMKPFDAPPDGVLRSQKQLCTLYAPITLGAPCNITSPRKLPGSDKVKAGLEKKQGLDFESSNQYSSSVEDPAQKPNGNRQGQYDKKGYNSQGYDRSGFDQMGWDKDGFSRANFNRDHIDVDGYDIFGYNRYGFNRSNVTSFGMKRDGTFISTASEEVVDKLFQDGYNRYGLDPFGMDRNGFDAFGFRTDGYDKDRCNYYFHGPHYLRFYFFAQLQLGMAGPGALTRIKRICPRITPLPEVWVTQNWLAPTEESLAAIRRMEQQWASLHPFDRDYIPNISSVKESGLWVPITPDLRFCFELHWFSGCPVGSAPVTCPDLCASTQCVGYPDAECRVQNCGSCFTEWYDRATGGQVMCQGW